ncbi:MAG TPA: TetR/AcrR family transcriptional regulator [Planctomycetota bacterium]|nr:TetR/AcrR family transcriptional regulator [Planctomycetota bacterium]
MGNREKLLEAATAILGRNGYQATSVDEILESAGVAPSNFYYHFKSKEVLAIEVLEGYFEKSRQEMAPVFMNRSLTATQKLERLHEALLKKATKNSCCGGCPMGNLAQELSDSHPEFRVRLARHFEECIDAIAGVIQEGLKAGEFRDGVDPRSAAYLIFGSMQGLMLLAKSMKKIEPMETGFRQTLELLKKVL